MSLAKLSKLADPEILAKNLLEMQRKAKGLLWSLTRPQVPDPVFVIGCSRSGTTITFETLAASGAFLNFGYEIPQFWNRLYGPHINGWESEAAGEEHARPEHRDAALRFFYQRLGAGRVLDKTCVNTLRIRYLYRLFPQAKFVFIHRDGRDNVSSLMDGWKHGRTDGGFGLEKFFGCFPEKVAINGGEFREWHFFIPPGWRSYNNATLEEVCAFQWVSANSLALDAKSAVPQEQWIELRYEDLFESPRAMFQALFERLEIPFDAAMRARCEDLQPTSIVKGTPMKEKWRAHNREAVERILPIIAPMMHRLGYTNL